MNNTKKRQLNIRNKLIAAIAMLLVSSIMMVSTTYAWFTLSTAPEVQGITTTVGANGNLEIALAPLSGVTSDIKSAVGDSKADWTVKNTTWGNLLDLGNKEYELDKIVLNPSQIKLTAKKLDTATGSLAYPKYGSDGRISDLVTGTSIGVKVDETEAGAIKLNLSEGFQLLSQDVTGGYGVRAIGTSSGQTENQRVFNQGLSALRSGTTQANGLASASLNANGNALANLMVSHALAAEGAVEDYSKYVPAITSLVTSLNDSLDQIDVALKGAITTVAASKLTGTALKSMQTIIESATSISDLVTDLKAQVPDSGNAALAYSALTLAVGVRDGIEEKIDGATAALANLDGGDNTTPDGKISWAEISKVVTFLMNTAGVEINGTPYSSDRAEMEALVPEIVKAGGVKLTLGYGSGVYYDIHSMVGKVVATANVTIDVSSYLPSVGTMDLNASIETEYNDNLVYLTNAQSVITQNLEAAKETGTEGGSTNSKLDVYYGYILDFVFRTNASGSSLKLQTEAANRVYSDDTSSVATMGSGSTLTFTVPENVNANTVKGMVEGLRVVFYNTLTGEVYGIAKATDIQTASDTGNLVGKLNLCDFDDTGKIGEVKTGTDAAVLTKLDQNVPTNVSVMVSLDGNEITNADMLANGTVSGTLNLQFASTAELVPMENTDLKNMTAYTVKVNGQKVATIEGAGSYSQYVSELIPAGKEVETVTVKMGTTTLTDAYSNGLITVNNISGDVEITITYKQPVEEDDEVVEDDDEVVEGDDDDEIIEGDDAT